MRTAVDTSILFDVLLDDPEFGGHSSKSLVRAIEEGPVVVCPVTYAELAAYFPDAGDADAFLRDLTITVEQFDMASLRKAAQVWKQYARNRGDDPQCIHCGRRFPVSCPGCQGSVVWRQHLIPDFLIGAHAEVQANCLLTRDRGYYRTYFPTLQLLWE